MSIGVVYTELPCGKIVHDRNTLMFPYSHRLRIEHDNVKRLKKSIATMGLWAPIVVRATTFEGIAGNHRYLAFRELAEERGQSPDEALIWTALVTCEEGEAVSLSLAENELRTDLTRAEATPGFLRAYESAPDLAEIVLDVDGTTARQLRLLLPELDFEAEARERQHQLQRRLTREWVERINRRLAEYPTLRERFLDQLSHPSWVQAQSLEELDRAITRAILEQGIAFEAGKTWNSEPAGQCLGCPGQHPPLKEAIRDGRVAIREDGTAQYCCPHLRIFPEYVARFTPTAQGSESLDIGAYQDRVNLSYPPGTLSQGSTEVRGTTDWLLQQADAYCVAPDLGTPDSCFRAREDEAADAAAKALIARQLPAVLSDFVKQREAAGEFTWRHPQIDGQFCTPDTCRHAKDTPPGFVLALETPTRTEMVCIHADCGGAAQQAQSDQEENRRKLEEQRRKEALRTLRRVSAERTLLANDDDRVDLSSETILEVIERILVPNWDTPSQFHVILGWQEAMRAQIARELQAKESSDRRVTAALRERYGEMADRPADAEIHRAFQALRRIVIAANGVQRWVACLALVQVWRNHVTTLEEITRVLEQLSAVGVGPSDPPRAE